MIGDLRLGDHTLDDIMDMIEAYGDREREVGKRLESDPADAEKHSHLASKQLEQIRTLFDNYLPHYLD